MRAGPSAAPLLSVTRFFVPESRESSVRRMTQMPPAPPRRVLYVVGEDYAFLLNRLPMARAAQRAGFEVHVATNVNKRAGEIEAEGFILHSIPFRRGGLAP